MATQASLCLWTGQCGKGRERKGREGSDRGCGCRVRSLHKACFFNQQGHHHDDGGYDDDASSGDFALATGWLMPGTVLHALIAFDPRHSSAQVLCYPGGIADEITKAWEVQKLAQAHAARR